MKRNAFGQLGPAFAPTHHRPLLRYFAPVEGEGGGGEGGNEFKAPTSQEELDKLINGAVARTHKQYEGLKEKAGKWDAHEAAQKPKPEPKPKAGENEQATVLTQEDVDKRIEEARAADRLELALERVNDALDKALEGRTFSASALFTLDREQFVKDGKAADMDAIKEWVKTNSKEIEQPDPKRKPIPGQGERGEPTVGLESGKSAYEKRHPKKN